VVLIVALVALFVLLLSLRGIAGFYTDYLWYDSLGQWGVRRGILGAQLSLALIFVTAFFLLAWSNLYVSEMVAPPFRPTGPEDELLERYHDLVAGRMGRVRVVVAGLLALIAGSGASAEWNEWILFTNGGNFGIKDPQFGRDVGFYVFRLPFMSFVVDWLFASLLIVLIITAVAHYLNGGIRVQPPSPRVTPQVKAHLSVLLAALALVKTADYFLQRFELTVSTRGVVDGATYTDINAQLPALSLLVLISVAAAALFIVNIFRRGWALPLVAVALWVFVAVAVGGIYPQFVQSFRVNPNTLSRESEFIGYNIDATRAAMGLSEVDVQNFTPTADPDEVDLASAQATIRNIRLWDPSQDISGQAFQQLQRIRAYYNISDIDVDRYTIDGQPTQVGVGVRDLQPDRVPGNSWENEHLAYTHGYGAALATANGSEGREPEFLVRDIPVRTEGEGLSMERPGIYFGEQLGGYAVVNTERNEIDFQSEEQTETTVYDGEDGVKAGSIFRRAAFALRFGNINPLISDYLTDDSRIIYRRDILDRIEALAPFLDHDADPYPVLLGDRTLWVVDLYTTTSRYPYAQRADRTQLSDSSGLDHRFNYVRNSVKATVDAYDGTVEMYVVDEEDPIIEAYRKAFPDLFSDADDMPESLEEHLRYPEDLFRVQTSAWERYHLSDAEQFFNEDDGWRVARDPGRATVENTTTQTTTADEASEGSSGSDAPRVPPYYQLQQLPGEEEAEFVLMRPFVPFSENDENQQLTAFMAARMDPGHYGELKVYEMPTSDLPDGPRLALASIQATDAVSQQETLYGAEGGGSQVRYGNLLLVPIDEALVYVLPMYVESEGEGQIPRLTNVIAVLGNEVVIEPTLQEALSSLFDQEVATQEDPTAEPPSGDEGEEPTGTAAEQAQVLLSEAGDLFNEADAALAAQDLATYQEKTNEAREKVQEAVDLLEQEAGVPPDDATTSTTTTSDTRPA
jgi:uncharacterized membrane protein (UPF0182 family)